MKPEFHRKVLGNGMTLIFEKRDLPIVSVAFAVRNGGINEELNEKGISHFIEHMLYKGTEKRNARQLTSEIEKNGGIFNGFTDEIITAYWCKIPSKKLDVALDVLSDMIKNPKLDEKELEKERKVIFEEIKMNHDFPRRYVLDEIQKLLYEGTMGIPLIGTYKTMDSINREKMVEKFKRVYQPNNLVLAVVGNANFEEIVKFCEKNFGNEKGEVPEFEIKIKKGSKIEKRKGIDQANLIFAYPAPLLSDPKDYAARLLLALMAHGLSSRLFHEIREKRNLAYSIGGDSDVSKKYAHSFIYVGTMKENVEKVKKLILEEFEKVAKELDEKELNAIKEQMIGQWEIEMEDSQIQMVNLLYNEINGNAKDFYEFGKNINSVNLKDVKELAKKVKDNFSFFALVPSD